MAHIGRWGSELTYFGRIAQEARQEEAGRAIEALCAVLDLGLTPARKKHMHALDLGGLHRLREHLVQHRSWPK